MNTDYENRSDERLVPANSPKTTTFNKKQVIAVVAIIFVAVVIVIAWSMGPKSDQTRIPKSVKIDSKPIPSTPTPVPVKTAADPVNITPEPQPIELVVEQPVLKAPPPKSLVVSDSQVLLAVADFAPTLGKWLLPRDQIRKWVMTIDLLADGKIPKRYRPLDFPLEKFKIDQNKNSKVMSATNFSRMNPVIETITATDPEKLSQYYKQWLPLLETAYQELGKKGSFDQRFKQAITQILASEPLKEKHTLIRPSVVYQFAEKPLEQASDVDKILWRLGPNNSERVQLFLRELRFYISES